ncbi:hypothetical protein [Bradyrhizobium sp. LHD-71]|uniref:hypothetical protein n=1 Tax=Bradyrhizobium sp. LHD-71 TaxID=3072141 RepID=UPI00280C61B5|nr:hypothetical protein [Bradyrhizobium sp. LHD-71]MDQ8726382.1 hypothetical protein [Bradyrhizobium sp. LHD-71]
MSGIERVSATTRPDRPARRSGTCGARAVAIVKLFRNLLRLDDADRRPDVQRGDIANWSASAMSKLTADTETFYLKPGMTLSTGVNYEIDDAFTVLWRRFVGQPWTKENLVEDATTAAEAAELEREGRRLTPLMKPGDVLQYGLLPQELDPNNSGMSLGRFRPLITIFALLEQPGPSDLILPLEVSDRLWLPDRGSLLTGGTFHDARLLTRRPAHLVMKVGRDAPVQGPFGSIDIASPVVTVSGFIGTAHGLTAQPLIPGTRYHVVVRASDAQGSWQNLHYEITTKRRKVEVQFDRLVVHDDSDSIGIEDTGEARFWFKVHNGPEVKEFHLGEIEIDDSNDPSNSKKIFDLNFKHTIGPEALNGEGKGVGVSTEGREYDRFEVLFTLFYSTDDAHYWHPGRPDLKTKYINFPTGLQEEVPFQSEGMTAGPTDGELHYAVVWHWSVTYE